MTKRKLRDLGYKELFGGLIPKDRRKVNEKMIWAVNVVTDLDGRSPIGAKAFLEGRGRQLIIEMKREGFKTASKRFRGAILQWKRARDPVPENA